MAFLKWAVLVLFLQFQGMFLPPLFFFSYHIFKDRFWFMYSHGVDSLKHIVLCIFSPQFLILKPRLGPIMYHLQLKVSLDPV